VQVPAVEWLFRSAAAPWPPTSVEHKFVSSTTLMRAAGNYLLAVGGKPFFSQPPARVPGEIKLHMFGRPQPVIARGATYMLVCYCEYVS
jgi:hypothetical protein